jgi:hypothetical protein
MDYNYNYSFIAIGLKMMVFIFTRIIYDKAAFNNVNKESKRY